MKITGNQQRRIEMNIVATETELKPCPFCGAEGVIETNGVGSYWGRCSYVLCGCSLFCESSIEEAARLWNNRQTIRRIER